MIKIKKILIYFSVLTLALSLFSVLSFAGTTANNGWGIASWHCEKSSPDFKIDYNSLRAEIIKECNISWNLASQEEWNNEQYELFINKLDAAVDEAKANYEYENVEYNVVAAFSLPTDPAYLSDYVNNCKPFVYIMKDGQIYSRTPLSLMENNSEYAVASAIVKGFGEYEAMICHNGEDAIPTAQSPDYKNFSTVSLSVYKEGAKCSYTSKMSEAFAKGIIDSYDSSIKNPDFTDVTEDAWYYDDVLKAVNRELMQGKTESLFCPQENITYAEAITIASRINACFKGKNPYLYFDTFYTPWYKSYVNYAKANDIPWKYEDYNAAISREEFVNILYSAIPSSELEEINTVASGAIPDVPIDSEYAEKIYTFYRAGIVCGDEKGSFNPKASIQRSEVASILCRIMEE